MHHQPMRIGPLTFSEVENIMVAIWCALEKHNLKSPQLARRFSADGRISVELTFKMPGDAEVVAQELDRSCLRALAS